MSLSEKAKNLELERLLFEYEYVQEEYKRREIQNIVVENLFHEQLQNYIKTDKELSNKWSKLVKSKDEEISQLVEPVAITEKAVKAIEPKANHTNLEKDIYRHIVKETHPDKNTELDSNKTNLYIQATKAYDTSDFSSLLLIGIKCGIPISNALPVDDLIVDITRKIQNIKGRSHFLSVTIPWKWYQSPDAIKNAIISTYVQGQLG